MAFNSKRINPLDLQPRKAVGVKLPFTAPAVFENTFTTKDAIRTNIINYFLTGVGERYMNPGFGTEIRNLMFNNLTESTSSELESEVRAGLSTFFPNVITKEFRIDPQPDSNLVTLFIRYAIQDTNIDDEVLINFEQ